MSSVWEDDDTCWSRRTRMTAVAVTRLGADGSTESCSARSRAGDLDAAYALLGEAF